MLNRGVLRPVFHLLVDWVLGLLFAIICGDHVWGDCGDATYMGMVDNMVQGNIVFCGVWRDFSRGCRISYEVQRTRALYLMVEQRGWWPIAIRCCWHQYSTPRKLIVPQSIKYILSSAADRWVFELITNTFDRHISALAPCTLLWKQRAATDWRT